MECGQGIETGELPGWISKWTRRLLSKHGMAEHLPELLAEIGAIASADRCFIYRVRGSSEIFDLSTEWAAPGVEKAGDQLPVLTRKDMPVLGEEILASKVVVLSNLDELPVSALKERELLPRLGIRSVVAVPFLSGEKVAGFLGVQSVTDDRKWDAATVTLLSSIAGIFSVASDLHEDSIQRERLHGFLEAAEDFVGFADPDTLEILYLNAAGKKLIGMGESDSLKGVTVDQVTPAPVLEEKREFIYSTISGKQTWSGEMMIQTLNDQEEIPVHQTMVKIPSADRPSGFVIGTIIRDLRKEKAFEQKCVESERLLRNFISAAPHALFLLNYKEARIVIGEKNFAGMTGYTVEELRSFEHGVYEPIHPDDIPAIEAQEAALGEATDEKVVPVTFRFRRKDGGWDWLEVHSKVFERDENGHPLSEVGMAQVITERKLAEERLREIEERKEIAVRGTNDGLWDSDLTTGKDWWSPRVYEMLGYEEGSIEPEYDSYRKLLHPKDREHVRQHLDSHLEEGTEYDVEFRLRTQSGEYRWFRSRGQAIPSENGPPTRMAGSIQDVHMRKQIVKDLHRESELNRVILETMSGFAFVLDAEGNTVRWNRAASEMTGYSDDELRETPLLELLFPVGSRQRALSQEEIEQVRNGSAHIGGMRKIWTKDGTTRTTQFNAAGIFDGDGQMRYFVVTGFDLSEFQRLQREVIRVVEQEQLRIGADLHDGLGQLLTGISDLSEALTLRTRDSRSIQIAGNIYMQVRNAISEVRRMSHGLTPASIENHGLAGSLRVLAKSVEEQSGIRCEVSIEELAEVRDIEMTTTLFRIAQEAVNNAVKHSEADTISILLTESESENILTIEDDGVGIDSKLKSGEARGVGLTIMDYRVGLIGGKLTVANRPEGGTRVECRLLVDFDRLDRLKSGKVFLYKSKFKKPEKEQLDEPDVKIVDSR